MRGRLRLSNFLLKFPERLISEKFGPIFLISLPRPLSASATLKWNDSESGFRSINFSVFRSVVLRFLNLSAHGLPIIGLNRGGLLPIVIENIYLRKYNEKFDG